MILIQRQKIGWQQEINKINSKLFYGRTNIAEYIGIVLSSFSLDISSMSDFAYDVWKDKIRNKKNCKNQTADYYKNANRYLHY